MSYIHSLSGTIFTIKLTFQNGLFIFVWGYAFDILCTQHTYGTSSPFKFQSPLKTGVFFEKDTFSFLLKFRCPVKFQFFETVKVKCQAKRGTQMDRQTNTVKETDNTFTDFTGRCKVTQNRVYIWKYIPKYISKCIMIYCKYTYENVSKIYIWKLEY